MTLRESVRVRVIGRTSLEVSNKTREAWVLDIDRITESDGVDSYHNHSRGRDYVVPELGVIVKSEYDETVRRGNHRAIERHSSVILESTDLGS